MGKKLEFTEEELQEYGGDYSKAAKAWKMRVEKLKKRRQRLEKKSRNGTSSEKSVTRPPPKVSRYGTSTDTNEDVPLRDKDRKIEELQLELAALRQSNQKKDDLIDGYHKLLLNASVMVYRPC